ncbi:YqhV family protein [Brevibacillus brevis]|uniref:YqhV family protein n=1 Tax=Brevibacillus brevis TaxID=1393 RepID=A0ABY9TB71_BREBE|nr:YqhV family protein [Brevibacillus brevis]WNC17119.1 YqhV family protein [Brevibacillus brevis]
MWEKAILGMAVLRMLSGSVEILAALLILKVNEVEKALLINSGLAIVGPIILISTTTIGLLGISDRVSFAKIAWILVGITCILIGVRK